MYSASLSTPPLLCAGLAPGQDALTPLSLSQAIQPRLLLAPLEPTRRGGISNSLPPGSRNTTLIQLRELYPRLGQHLRELSPSHARLHLLTDRLSTCLWIVDGFHGYLRPCRANGSPQRPLTRIVTAEHRPLNPSRKSMQDFVFHIPDTGR